MPINLDEALGAELQPVEFSWSSSDVQLYHLGPGRGRRPVDQRELRYLADGTPQVLPTFGNVAPSSTRPSRRRCSSPASTSSCAGAARQRGSPCPRHPAVGTARAVTRFTDIWDKGKAAVIWSET